MAVLDRFYCACNTNIPVRMAISEDPDQTAYVKEQSELDLHCLTRPLLGDQCWKLKSICNTNFQKSIHG